MPEESGRETKPSELPGLTPKQTAKANSIFRSSSNIGLGGRVIEPEPTKLDMLSSMERALIEAVKKGDVDKAGAINRNIEAIKKELGIKPKG